MSQSEQKSGGLLHTFLLAESSIQHDEKEALS
jgi:hypothetical protein